MDLHFNQSRRFELNDIQANECPSCALKGVRQAVMAKEEVSSKKILVRHLEQSDVNDIRASLEAEPLQDVSMGDEYRQETDDEKEERLRASVKSRGISNEATITNIVQSLMATQPNITRKVSVKRQETVEEKESRINHTMLRLRLATAEEIAESRRLYEDI